MARPVRAEIGVSFEQASSLSKALNAIQVACPPETAEIETSQNYERALNCSTGLPRTNWKLAPNPGAGGDDSRAHNRFRLISPALKTLADYNSCAEFLQKIEAIPSIEVNSNTGFRLHVSSHGLKFDGLVRLCQNFVKYEDAIDSILPPSRRSNARTNGAAADSYFQSNKSALNHSTKKECNDAIAGCTNTEQLMLLLNPDGKCYKLNLRNLNLQHPTLEFRSHSATSNKLKIQSWVGLCLSLVDTAEEGSRNPTAFKESRILDEEFDGLLKNIVKKESLQEFLTGRKAGFDLSKTTGKKRALSVKTSSKTVVAGKSECQCCFQKFKIALMCACQEKKHWFCKKCVQQYAKTQLFSNLESRLQCMSTDGCSSDLNTLHLKKLLPKKIVAKVHEVQYLKSMEGKKEIMCECPKCGNRAILPKKETTFSCPLSSCRHQSCRLCNETSHEPLTCAQAKQQKVTGARSTIEESMTDAYVRRCPNCNCAFVRESGCNKMTCRSCNALSCYICRQLIQGVHHFNEQRCPLYTNAADMTDRQNVRSAGNAAEQLAQRDLATAELEGLVQRLL